MRATPLQVNAALAMLILAGLAGGILWVLAQGDIDGVEGELAAALLACIAGIAYSARVFSDHVVNGLNGEGQRDG